MLIVFSGLPGTGKTTIAQKVAARIRAVYLRIDTLEQTLRNTDVQMQDVGRAGYTLANELALSNLQLGNTVVVDCVNPVAESRNAWREIALQADARLLDVQVICSDETEHRRRVEQRSADIPGLIPPTWSSVLAHDYQAWDQPPFTLDSALNTAEQAVALILERMRYPHEQTSPSAPAREGSRGHTSLPGLAPESNASQMTLRNAEPRDLAKLLDLYRHLNPDNPHLETDKAISQLESLKRYPASEIIVGELHGEIVTTCTLVVIPNLTRGATPYALIENVVTHSEHRRMGYGKLALEHAIDGAWRAGCYKVMLLTGSKRPSVHQFYLAAGFEQSKTGFQVRRIAARG